MSELITIKEFLHLYKMGRTTFYQLVKRGDLSIRKVGKASRVTRAEAERWVANLPAG